MRPDVSDVIENLNRWTGRNIVPVDAAGTLVLILVVTLANASSGSFTALIGIALCAPLAVRRSLPELSGALIAGVALLQVPAGTTFNLGNIAVLASVYAMSAYARRWASLGGLFLGLLGAPLAALLYFSAEGPVVVLVVTAFVAVLVLASWALGGLRRASRRNALSQQERARLLQNEREQELRMAAVGERQRIAREMHDVVAHSLSVIIAQADGGRYAAATDPAVAAESLATISATGRQALADMRNLLGVLRAGPADERTPQPDAEQIPDLVAQVRASGLPIAYGEEGHPRDLVPAVGLAAYRIVQESLTNILKHAGPAARARVELHWADDALDLLVEDDGRGAGAPGSTGGQGLVGMAERARLHGGSLHARARPGGGFAVRARLPYGRSATPFRAENRTAGPTPEPVREPVTEQIRTKGSP